MRKTITTYLDLTCDPELVFSVSDVSFPLRHTSAFICSTNNYALELKLSIKFNQSANRMCLFCN